MASETITKNDLKGVLDAVLPPSNNLFHEETISASGLSGSTYYGSFSLNIPTVSGYQPVTVRNLALNQANKTIYAWSVDSTNMKLSVGVANVTLSGTISSLYIQAVVVYLRI